MSLNEDRVKVVMAGKKIRTPRTLLSLGACFVGLAAYGAACSLPDRTFIDDTAGTGNGGAGAGTGGSSSSGRPNGGTTSGGSSGTGETGMAGEAGATTDPSTDRPTPTKGLIVIGGTAIDETQGVISVIEPVTGTELSKELLPSKTQIAGIAYDGADKKDVWYVFVGGTFPAAEDNIVELQVRYFNDKTNKWITLSKAPAQTPPIPGTLTVLNDRLAYLSHTVIGGIPTPTLTILDTSDVLNVQPVTYTPSSEVGDMVTLIGTRGTAVDPLQIGGTLDLGFAEKCTANKSSCELHVLPISVAKGEVNGVARLIGTYKGTALAASNQLTQQANFVLSDTSGNVAVYYTDPDAPAGATSFAAPQNAPDMYGLTIAECQNLAIFSADSENALYAVRFNNGAGKTIALGRPGQLVAYEPFSTDVITTYNPVNDDFKTAPEDAGISGPDVTAISIVAPLMGSSITTTLRAGWAPPTDVRTNVIATRFPVSFKCP